jgi:hypothetical protein
MFGEVIAFPKISRNVPPPIRFPAIGRRGLTPGDKLDAKHRRSIPPNARRHSIKTRAADQTILALAEEIPSRRRQRFASRPLTL